MEKECAHCGDRFLAKRKSRLYCSDNCKQLAYYKRNGLVLQGNRSQHVLLGGHGIVKDVNISAAFSESFITRLNALIEEEVQSRLVQRLSADSVVKQNGTVKSYFTQSDNNISATNHITGDNRDSDYSHDVDVKDDIYITPESRESFTQTENVNSRVELSNEEQQPEYSKDVDVKDDTGTTTKSVESLTQTEDPHLEPIDFPDDDEPVDSSNDVSVKDDINTTSESIASFTESKVEIESAESSNCSIPDIAIYSDTQSSEALNVKHEPEASFTVTSVNDGQQDVDNDAEFEKALAVFENLCVSDIDSSKYREDESLTSATAASVLSQAPLDSNQPFNVKESVIAKDKKEKILAIITSLQVVARKDVFNQPIRESLQQDNLLKPDGANNKPAPQHNLPFNVNESATVKESFTATHNAGIAQVKAQDILNVDRAKHTQDVSEFEWVHSTFIEQINKHPRRVDIQSLRYRSSPGQCKILMVTKNLLQRLMLLTLCKEVDRHALWEISNVFFTLINSEEFSSLPKDFPYQKTVMLLHKQLRSIAEKATRKPAPLRISRAQRAEIFTIISEMKYPVKNVDFRKLKITDTLQ